MARFEDIQSEADVDRFFYQQVEPAFRLPGPKTQRLQREMRGYVPSLYFEAISLLTKKKRYAYHYDCPQVFVFDSVSLLILQFKVQHKDEILMHDCAIDCCLIPIEIILQGQSTIQYALY